MQLIFGFVNFYNTCFALPPIYVYLFCFYNLVLFIYFLFFKFILLEANYFTVSGFCYTLIWISRGCICVPHPESPSHLHSHPIPQADPSVLALSSLYHASHLDWLSSSHMAIYLFQCYSLKSSHPRLFPQSPKVCSLSLCLFCCLAYRVIVTIFLNSIYMHEYTVLGFFFLTYFTLYNRLQFHPPH